jgi:hypothetical protein
MTSSTSDKTAEIGAQSLMGGRTSLEGSDARALRAELDALSGELDSLNRKLDQAVIDTDRRAKELLRDTGNALKLGVGGADGSHNHLESLIWARLEARLEQRLTEEATTSAKVLKALQRDVVEMGAVVNQLAERAMVSPLPARAEGTGAFLLGGLAAFFALLVGVALASGAYLGLI